MILLMQALLLTASIDIHNMLSSGSFCLFVFCGQSYFHLKAQLHFRICTLQVIELHIQYYNLDFFCARKIFNFFPCQLSSYTVKIIPRKSCFPIAVGSQFAKNWSKNMILMKQMTVLPSCNFCVKYSLYKFYQSFNIERNLKLISAKEYNCFLDILRTRLLNLSY